LFGHGATKVADFFGMGKNILEFVKKTSANFFSRLVFPIFFLTFAAVFLKNNSLRH
jgi:hypothetical protein